MAGLSFDNYQRNQFLSAKGYGAPTATSTGTTIVGVKFDGGVVVSIQGQDQLEGNILIILIDRRRY